MPKRIAQSNWACVSRKKPESSKDLLIIRVKEDLGFQTQVTWLRPGDHTKIEESQSPKTYLFKNVYGPVCGSRAQAHKHKEDTISSLRLPRITSASYRSQAILDSLQNTAQYIPVPATTTANPFSFWSQEPYTNNLFQSIRSILATWPATTNYQNTAFGYNTTLDNNSIAIGNNATAAGVDSIAIGYAAAAPAIDSVAIGQGAYTPTIDSVAIGNDATAVAFDAITVGQDAYNGYGTGGNVYITGGSGGTTGSGGSITITGGNGTSSSNGSGGDVSLTAASSLPTPYTYSWTPINFRRQDTYSSYFQNILDAGLPTPRHSNPDPESTPQV